MKCEQHGCCNQAYCRFVYAGGVQWQANLCKDHLDEAIATAGPLSAAGGCSYSIEPVKAANKGAKP